VRGKMPKPPSDPFHPLIHYITLSLNISISRQNVKNQVGYFGAIHVGITHAKFDASNSTGVGGEWGDSPSDK